MQRLPIVTFPPAMNHECRIVGTGMALLEPRKVGAQANRTEEGYFRPKPRGKLRAALGDEDGRTKKVQAGPEASAFERIAPESPRPSEMLEEVTVVGDDRLTVTDIKLHELMVSQAYEVTDRMMDRDEYVLPATYALRFLGDGARRKGIRESLKRLRSTVVSYGTAGGRLVQDVPLICSWLEQGTDTDEIRYTIPRPVSELMASQPRYAYIELGPLSQMSSKYGVRLYRHLALDLAGSRREWEPAGENLHEVAVDVARMKSWLGRDGDHVGQMQLRALKPAIADLVHVRRFSLEKIEPIKGKRRGGGIDGWNIVLRINPPAAHHGRMQTVSEKLRGIIVGAPDAPRFFVRQDFWQRKGGLLQRHGYANGFTEAFGVWLLALDEALTGDPITAGYSTRRMRGERLLAAVARDGALEAANALLVEELEAPDLLTPVEGHDARMERRRRVRRAGRARYHRHRDAAEGADRRRKAPANPAPTAAAQPSREEAAQAPAPAPQASPKRLRVTFSERVDQHDVDALWNVLMSMTWAGEGPELPVEFFYTEGPGWVTWEIGSFPASPADILKIRGAANVTDVEYL